MKLFDPTRRRSKAPAASRFVSMPIPQRLQVPLAPHPVQDKIEMLESGTRLRAGECLCRIPATSDYSAIAPACGTVADPIDVRLCDGQRVPGVEFATSETDSPDQSPVSILESPMQAIERALEAQASDLGSWTERLRSAGIWADRTASPHLIQQLHQALRRPIDTVICSVLDSDPELRINHELSQCHGSEMLAGVSLVAKLTGAARVWMIHESDVRGPDGRLVAELAKRIDLRAMPLRNDYPLSDPTILLYSLLARRLRPGRLPTEQGVLLLDGIAAVAIGQNVISQRPMSHLPIGVHDHAHRASYFGLAPVGASVGYVLSQMNLPTDGITLRGGDLLRDVRISPSSVIGGGEVAIHLTIAEAPVNPDPCIRCGWCVDGCPVRIQPAALLEAAQSGNTRMAEKYGIEACIECGICSYVCPSNLPLLDGIRKLKVVSG